MSKENPGKWHPCGCRQNIKDKAFVRVCPEHKASGTTPKEEKAK